MRIFIKRHWQAPWMQNKTIAIVFPKDSIAIFNDSVVHTFGGATVEMYLIAQELSMYKDLDVICLIPEVDEDIGNTTPLKTYPTFKSTDPLISKLFKFHRSLTKNQPDIIIQHGMTIYSCLLPLYCKLFGIKFIFMFASDVEAEGYYQTGKKKAGLFGTLIRYADVLITQNKYQYDVIFNNFNRKTNILYNGFPMDKENIPEPADKENVLWVGRCDRAKRPEKYIEIASAFPEISFIMICNPVCGQEDYFSQIQQAAAGPGNIELLEYVPFSRIDEYFKRATFFINTSDYEGFPQAFIQAAKSATPILSLNVDPDGFIEKFECGFCCYGDLNEMKNKLREFSADTSLHRSLSVNALKYARDHHDIKKNVKELYRILI